MLAVIALSFPMNSNVACSFSLRSWVTQESCRHSVAATSTEKIGLFPGTWKVAFKREQIHEDQASGWGVHVGQTAQSPFHGAYEDSVS